MSGQFYSPTRIPFLNTHKGQSFHLTKHERVSKLLLEGCESHEDREWPWLADNTGRIDKRNANKFLLGARIDYAIPADRAWDNAEVLVKIVLGDPDDLWSAIDGMGLDALEAAFRGEHLGKACRRCAEGHDIVRRPTPSGAPDRHKALHMWPNKTAGHVWKMAHIIMDRYGGDPRKLWEGRETGEILSRLTDATFGPELSRMVAGALSDTGQVKGKGRLKADLNVTRVIGRVFTGSKTTPGETHAITDIMEPGNSWKFDGRLFILGQYTCTSKYPNCSECCLKEECVYAGGPKA